MEAVAETVLDRFFTPQFPDVERYRRMFLATRTRGLRTLLRRAPTLRRPRRPLPDRRPDARRRRLRRPVHAARAPRVDRRACAGRAARDDRRRASSRDRGAPRRRQPSAPLAPVVSREEGMRVRREVLGDEHVDRAIERTPSFTPEFQDLITAMRGARSGRAPGSTAGRAAASRSTALVAAAATRSSRCTSAAARRNGLTRRRDQGGAAAARSTAACPRPTARSRSPSACSTRRARAERTQVGIVGAGPPG